MNHSHYVGLQPTNLKAAMDGPSVPHSGSAKKISRAARQQLYFKWLFIGSDSNAVPLR